MSVNWIEYKEKKILFINASNLVDQHDSLLADLETLAPMLQKEAKNSVLALADLRNTHLSNTTIVAMMSQAPRVAPFFYKSALVIEENNARRIVLDSFSLVIGRLPKRFAELESAKEWLISE